MRQVPEINPRYLVVGNGRLATHLTHYLGLLNIPFKQYTRQSPQPFTTFLQGCSHVLVLIRDKEIVTFLEHHKPHATETVTWVHCSGALQTDLAECAHPLASFSDHLFEDAFYKTIPFKIEQGGRSLREILPGFPNPAFQLDQSATEKYHAMCVLAGNFSTILWLSFEKYLAEELQVPKTFMLPYLHSVTNNLAQATNPLTGPLVRNDQETIQRNLRALKDDALKELYESFVNFYTKTHP